VTRRLLAAAALLFALPLADARLAAATPDDNCTQQSLRVRLPGGFASARLTFSGLLKNGRTRVGEQFTMGDLRELRVVTVWTAADDDAHLQRVDLYAPDGTLLARTRKLHLPVTAGYYEDRYFQAGDTGFPIVALDGAQFGFPTCWDQWFPEVARSYALLGADVIVYPTAIGSEPDHPGFDTEPLWEQVIRANGIANGTFMVVPNRIGTEGPVTFYGSSFVSDPYGRVLVQAPRDEAAVLVADLDLDQRRDWLTLFPLLATRRPDAYGGLTR